MRIYLAGPLFTPYERAYLDEVAARLRDDGFDVFVPHEQALALDNTPADVIFTKDWDGLYNADAVLAILDGPQTDDGTACEIGIFYALMLWNTNKKGIVGLTHELMTLQATGDYAGTKRFLDRLVVMRPEVKAVLDRLGDIPVDIRPHFITAEDL